MSIAKHPIAHPLDIKPVECRMPIKLYDMAMGRIRNEIYQQMINDEIGAILQLLSWVVHNTSSNVNVNDWNDEKETEFKLRFL